MTVDYFLAYLKPFYPSWDDTLATELIRELQLPRDRRLGQLSRGMQMKAALASSLAYHPRLILLDEPFSGLDPLVRDEFIEGLLERAAGTTILVSSHDLVLLHRFRPSPRARICRLPADSPATMPQSAGRIAPRAVLDITRRAIRLTTAALSICA